ncbi:CFEM domain containing protein [Pyrenophora tritici-repentis]|nr:CFEM domain containing protein [Pyrenophora tritici-repentis]KAI1549085.1 hypothetical protein PtrSN001C_001858 [Pyrenophora tritici-repentis]KAI1557455.1 CFEM domain containing protein [Pyrenophora tritici-repentis]KAI1585499.1 CFEM domain containing protein [Pyrenophora tritici-repentis]PWO29752.1 hypothetical protein PtrARCrB10_01629 [Pyrenophora tritici-repentis]
MLGSTYLGYFLGPHKLHDVVGDLQQLLPQYATDCLTSALETVLTCSPENATCICTDPNAALGMHHCADKTCTIRQALVALNVIATVCQRPIRNNTIKPIVIGSVSGGLSILAVLLRTVDTVVDGHFGWGDACALGAGITSIPMTGFLLRIAFAGLGWDTWTLSPDRITYVQKLEWLTQIFYLPTTALPKLAFLLMYLRVFPQKQLRCYIHATIALTIFYWLFFEISFIFYCHPTLLIWQKWDREHDGKCWNINYLILSAAGATVCLHPLIILLPIPALLQLSMICRKKFEVIAVFAVGALYVLAARIQVYVGHS